jgi:hypothetical protein
LDLEGTPLVTHLEANLCPMGNGQKTRHHPNDDHRQSGNPPEAPVSFPTSQPEGFQGIQASGNHEGLTPTANLTISNCSRRRRMSLASYNPSTRRHVIQMYDNAKWRIFGPILLERCRAFA